MADICQHSEWSCTQMTWSYIPPKLIIISQRRRNPRLQFCGFLLSMGSTSGYNIAYWDLSKWGADLFEISIFGKVACREKHYFNAELSYRHGAHMELRSSRLWTQLLYLSTGHNIPTEAVPSSPFLRLLVINGIYLWLQYLLLISIQMRIRFI